MPRLTRGQRLLQELRGKGYKARRPDWPDFYGRVPASPCTNGFGDRGVCVTPAKEQPHDAKQFPVGNSHKQGPQLLTPDAIKTDLAWMSGKKT